MHSLQELDANNLVEIVQQLGDGVLGGEVKTRGVRVARVDADAHTVLVVDLGRWRRGGTHTCLMISFNCSNEMPIVLPAPAVFSRTYRSQTRGNRTMTTLFVSL